MRNTETQPSGTHRRTPHGGVRPLTREQWAALDPANRFRARIHLTDGTCIHGICRPDRDAAQADLDELLPGVREMRERHAYMAQVVGGDVEDRGKRED